LHGVRREEALQLCADPQSCQCDRPPALQRAKQNRKPLSPALGDLSLLSASLKAAAAEDGNREHKQLRGLGVGGAKQRTRITCALLPYFACSVSLWDCRNVPGALGVAVTGVPTDCMALLRRRPTVTA
jgi:hypothetical protein